MQARKFVELAGSAAEIAGVLLIVGGLLIASARNVVAPKSCRTLLSALSSGSWTRDPTWAVAACCRTVQSNT